MYSTINTQCIPAFYNWIFIHSICTGGVSDSDLISDTFVYLDKNRHQGRVLWQSIHANTQTAVEDFQEFGL